MEIKKELALIHFIKSNLGRSFAWGRCDCNTFALEMVDAVYGTSLAETVLGKYDGMIEAARFRKESEWGNFQNLLSVNGFTEGKQGFEQIGDLLVVEDEQFELVSIYMGIKSVACVRDIGVQLFPTVLLKEKTYRVWRYHD